MIAMDPKPRRKLDLSHLDLLTPNHKEALELLGYISEDNIPSPEDLLKSLQEKISARNLAITMGPEGMMIGDASGDMKHLPTVAREVFDVSGAGDTVIALMTASLAAGFSLSEAAQLANRAAGIVVSHVGTTPISEKEFFNGS